ncbi:MAG: hypothetical protein AUG49_11320 [Catenulispora sp. 13_1_20CM_3_70_7]|nr:MAG: hypothetical protein AUG49_11320 [Catenulispora sp. 13_1_20CM_3_70_7]
MSDRASTTACACARCVSFLSPLVRHNAVEAWIALSKRSPPAKRETLERTSVRTASSPLSAVNCFSLGLAVAVA